ncbi:ABC transporter permease [Nocardiopsis aegyptia]|uniref:ABC transporter permease n=1 Tax=Nocardiopsis aegyptia TaxID=220378 RepID=UPI0036705EF1
MLNLINAELRKFFSTRMWWIMLLVVLGWTGLGLSLSIGMAGVEGQPGLASPEFQQTAWPYSGGATTFTMIVGVLIVTNEYRHRTFNNTFLVSPNRTRVVMAKLATGVIAGLMYGTAALVLTAAAVVPAVLGAGGEFSPTANEIPRMSLGILVALTVYVLLGVGLGALLRNQVAAILVAIAWTFLLETVLTSVPALQDVGQWTPGGATSALYDTGMDYGFGAAELLPFGVAAAVLAGYAAVCVALALVTTVRRDLV